MKRKDNWKSMKRWLEREGWWSEEEKFLDIWGVGEIVEYLRRNGGEIVEDLQRNDEGEIAGDIRTVRKKNQRSEERKRRDSYIQEVRKSWEVLETWKWEEKVIRNLRRDAEWVGDWRRNYEGEIVGDLSRISEQDIVGDLKYRDTSSERVIELGKVGKFWTKLNPQGFSQTFKVRQADYSSHS